MVNPMIQAIKAAKRSPFTHKTGAVILSNPDKRYKSIGWAHHSSHPLRRTYSMHAEIHALLRYKYDHEDLNIYIATLSRANNLVSARPCISCAIALKEAGVQYAHYSIAGGYETLDLQTEFDLSTFKEYPGINGRND